MMRILRAMMPVSLILALSTASVAEETLVECSNKLIAESKSGHEASKLGDFAKAIRIWTEAAVKGNIYAQADICLFHLTDSTPEAIRDLKTGFANCLAAAKRGLPQAQFMVGKMYHNGLGTEKSTEEGFYWWRRSAEGGHGEGQYYLGLAHFIGKGATQDFVQAHTWLNLAASDIYITKQLKEQAARARNDIMRFMTREQVSEAQKRARDWQPTYSGWATESCEKQKRQ